MMVAAAVMVGGCRSSAFLIEPVSTSRHLKETVVQKDKGLWVRDKIAIIDVDGVLQNGRIGGLLGSSDNPVSLFVEKLDKAQRDKHVKAVVLRLNSPGGTVSASDIMYHRLMEFRKNSHKPVVSCMLGVAASGAYYLACGSDGIMAQPSTITGSIGTIMQTMSFAGTMQKLGIKAVAIKSRELKDLASPLHDLTDKERQVLQGIINQYYQQFLAVVLRGRKGLTRAKLMQLADGRVYLAARARQYGLIDRIGYMDDAIRWAKHLAGIKKAKVVIYSRPFGYKPNVYGSAKAQAKAGALVNVEVPDWLRTGGAQFMYIWKVGNE